MTDDLAGLPSDASYGRNGQADVFDELARLQLVPVVALDTAAQADDVADALVEGGLPVVEVTFRTAAAEEAMRTIASRGDLLLGAGTVMTVEQVDRAVDAGASFVVSPGLSRAVVERALGKGIPVIPGAVTATEIQGALAFGLTTVKFFPAETSGGAPAVRALAAPFGSMRFVPTGGIGPPNLRSYLDLPAVHAVGGSWMVPRDLIAVGDVDKMRGLIMEAVALATESREH